MVTGRGELRDGWTGGATSDKGAITAGPGGAMPVREVGEPSGAVLADTGGLGRRSEAVARADEVECAVDLDRDCP